MNNVAMQTETKPSGDSASETNVGDLNSKAIGSGARFNQGKPDLSLIPLWMVSYLNVYSSRFQHFPDAFNLERAIDSVSKFQMGGDREHLFEALRLIETDWEHCARVFEFGKQKYAAWNWAKGMDWSIPIGCIGRHYRKIRYLGEVTDDDSGLPHLAHIECNIVMLIHYWDHYKEGDDRITKHIDFRLEGNE